MKVYSPSEVSSLLNIKQPTLRKYSIMLEERGYKIERNSQNHRYYQDKDIITLRRVITASKSGVTLDEAIKNVVSIDEDNTYTNAISNTVTTNDNDIDELKEMIHKQSEIIENLTTYIHDRFNHHDELLNQTLNESSEVKKQIAATEEKIEEKKKTWFSKLFK